MYRESDPPAPSSPILIMLYVLVTSSGGIPARNEKGERLLLFLGVIDILQSYRMIKKIEHTFKSVFTDGDTVSVHRPSFYAQRFLDFMANKVFRKIPSRKLRPPVPRIVRCL